MLVQVLLRRFAQISAAVGAIVLLASVAQAIDLVTDLSAEQFKTAGLDKLTRTELYESERLILAKHAIPPAAFSTTEQKASYTATPATSEKLPGWGHAPAESESMTLEPEVTDDFRGLFDAAKIALANGQVWQQTVKAIFDRKLRDKRVRIKPAMLGSWRLQFIDNNLFFTVKGVQ